jgi:adenylylsulfate kinase
MNRTATVWFMGLPCSGKTTIANKLYRSPNTIHLDGDILREDLCCDLGFTEKDRWENIRRAASVAKLLNNTGFNVTASFITPTEASQELVRDILDNVVMVYVKCPVEICIKRDVKGMYQKAIDGEIKEFTGISAPFDVPDNPEITLDTTVLTPDECIEILNEEIPKYWSR